MIKIQRAHEKILDALQNDDYLSADELRKMTGYEGITQRISELNNVYNYKIMKKKIDDVTKYRLLEDEQEEIDDEEDDKYKDISFEVSKKRVKDAQDAISSYYKIVKEARKDTKEIKVDKIDLKSDNETLILMNSDWHIGKKVIDEYGKEVYNTQLAQERLGKFYSNLRKLVKHIANSTTIDEIVIANIGDLVDGESIYEGQIFHIDEYLSKQVEIATREKLKQTEILQDDFGVPIREEFVVGNHGKGHASYEGMTNFDSLVHLNLGIIRDISKNKNWTINNGHHQKDRMIDVRGHKILMRHWAPSQSETAAAFKRYSGWLNIYKYDAMLTAHFHSPKVSYFQQRPIIRNGCIMGDDEYSRELGYTAKPCQIVMGVSNKRFPTFLYTLDMI